jgi:hypothetical protein
LYGYLVFGWDILETVETKQHEAKALLKAMDAVPDE